VESYLDYIDRDPYEFYERKLAEGPVHWDEGMRAWLVFGYEESRTVLVRADVYEHPYNSFAAASETQGGPRGILLLQGEEHTRMHNFLLSHFSPGVVRRYQDDLIQPLVKRRFDEVFSQTRVDLSSQFAGKVPSDVIAALLGLDWHDEDLLTKCRVWNTTIFRWSETFGEDLQATAEALEAAELLNGVLLPVIRERRERPREDLISVLWEKGPEIMQPWGEEEVLAQCRVLFFAGSDTTAHLLRNCIWLLANHPELQAQLRGDATRIRDFVDEVLRMFGPIHFRVRVAKVDVELGGRTIKAGDRLHPVLASADRDPRHYAEPASVNIDRKPLRDHLAFNAGPRFCVGAALARAEAAAAVEELLQRSPSLEWDTSADPPQFVGHMPRSHRPLNVVLTPGADGLLAGCQRRAGAGP
jgi:cytochrome P450